MIRLTGFSNPPWVVQVLGKNLVVNYRIRGDVVRGLGTNRNAKPICADFFPTQRIGTVTYFFLQGHSLHKSGIGALCPLPIKNKRSEGHTSELQSQSNLVCRLLLEKKNRISYLFRLY